MEVILTDTRKNLGKKFQMLIKTKMLKTNAFLAIIGFLYSTDSLKRDILFVPVTLHHVLHHFWLLFVTLLIYVLLLCSGFTNISRFLQ